MSSAVLIVNCFTGTLDKAVCFKCRRNTVGKQTRPAIGCSEERIRRFSHYTGSCYCSVFFRDKTCGRFFFYPCIGLCSRVDGALVLALLYRFFFLLGACGESESKLFSCKIK